MPQLTEDGAGMADPRGLMAAMTAAWYRPADAEQNPAHRRLSAVPATRPETAELGLAQPLTDGAWTLESWAP